MTVVAASVSRPVLGLADLDINDHLNYYVSNQSILSGTVQMRRNTVTSPFVASGFDVSAVPDLVQDVMSIEVMRGTTSTQLGLQDNLKALIAAFTQGYFNLTVQLDSAVYTYACNASDYTVDWTQGRALAPQVQAKFSLFRSPVAINGV